MEASRRVSAVLCLAAWVAWSASCTECGGVEDDDADVPAADVDLPDADAGDADPADADGDQEGRVSLSPEGWPAGELEAYAALQRRYPAEARAARGGEVMIVGTTSALAVRAGYEALVRGGSAVDAVLSAAMAQVVLAAGSYVSFGGILFLVCFDAATGEVSALNAGFDIPLAEDEPMTIPRRGSGIPSGRTALVPGFFAGVAAAHERFGALPFAALFDPAIYFARRGFELDGVLGGAIARSADVLTRLAETEAVFTAEDGSLYGPGDWLTQPALAETLGQVAAEGVDHVYRGPWAERFVAAVRAEGGRVTAEDMTRYEAVWTEPIASPHGRFEVTTLGLPSYGGVNTVEALALLELSGLAEAAGFSESPISLFWLAQIQRTSLLSFLGPDDLALVLPGVDLSREARRARETSARIWEAMERGELPLTLVPASGGGGHSDGLVAVDARGNVAALVHTINTTMWGETGIFVDGISIPDSACFQQEEMARAGPGARLAEATTPLVVLEGGRPVLASASIGGGIHQRTLSVVSSVLDLEMDVEAAQAQPAFGFPLVESLDASGIREVLRVGDVPPAVVAGARDLGLGIEEVSALAFYAHRGYWVGISIDEGGALRGVAAEDLNGAAVGH